MDIRLRLLREQLVKAISNIDNGNSNHTSNELEVIISSLTKLNRGIKRISKRYACDKILHCSLSTFDNYLALGLIPPGRKEVGYFVAVFCTIKIRGNHCKYAGVGRGSFCI